LRFSYEKDVVEWIKAAGFLSVLGVFLVLLGSFARGASVAGKVVAASGQVVLIVAGILLVAGIIRSCLAI
jgi:hypothetical protein